MSLTRCVVLAAAIGCVLATVQASGGDDKPPVRDDARIKAVVAYFAKNGVKLQHDKDNRWVVADPKGDGYEVDVYFRTFPEGATEQEMQKELRAINLGHMLNAPARVAMSVPGLRNIDPAKPLPKLDQVPVVAKLEKLFKEYRRAEPKK
jgi:hypothetical protein